MTTRTAQAAALADRLTRLRARLEQEGLDAMFATSRPAVIYLTGFPGEGFERLIATLVTREATYLIIPSLERETAEEDALGVELAVWADGEDAMALVVSLLSGVSSGPIRLGAEERSLSLAQADRLKRDLPGLELAHAGGLIADTRLRKDEAEVDHMRAAAGLLAAGLEAAYENASAGTSEVELQRLLELELKRLGGEEAVSLVQVGERAALPHGAAGGRRLSAGDVLLIDAAVTSGCYWADVTRCATVGPPSDEVTAAWDAVMAAHAAGVAAVGPGATASDVDRAAREEIVERGLGEAFIHRTGHGLGLEVHEAPYLSSTSGEVLQPGMVVTIEPGVYLRGRFGLRLEDDVLVTESGGEILTEAIPSGLRAL